MQMPDEKVTVSAVTATNYFPPIEKKSTLLINTSNAENFKNTPMGRNIMSPLDESNKELIATGPP